MKLYFSPGACSLSPHIVAREAGIPLVLEQVDTKTKKTKSGDDFWSVNAKGAVPALVLDNGETLTEGPAIVQYLAELKPESGLMPKPGSFARYRVLEWLNFISTEIHKQFTPLFKADTPEDYKPIARDNLMKSFTLVEKHLTGKQYLVDNTFTVADAYLFVIANWLRLQHIDIAQWPSVKAFHARVRARPAVQEALTAEGLLKPAAA
jgi:glutathione S-transferase